MELPKSYLNLDDAKRAIKRAGLHAMTVRYDDVTGSYRGAKNILPVVLCDLVEDKREVESRGFKADMKRKTFSEGATVRLNDREPGAKATDLAVLQRFLGDDIPGGVFLDRPLCGTRYWNVSALTLIAPEEEDA